MVVGAAAALLLPETLRQRQAPFSLRAMGGLYRSVLVHRGFLANLGILTAFVGLFAWIAGAPFVMQDLRTDADRVRHDLRGRCRGLHGRALSASRFVMRLGLDRTIGIGAVVMAFGGLAMAAAVALALSHVGWLVGTMTIYLAGMGLVLPPTMAGALTPFPDRAGTASSLMGFAQQTSAAIAAAAIGAYLGRSAWPVAPCRGDGLLVARDLGADAPRAHRNFMAARPATVVNHPRDDLRRRSAALHQAGRRYENQEIGDHDGRGKEIERAHQAIVIGDNAGADGTDRLAESLTCEQ